MARPLLFISHKHENRAIADVLRDFIEMNTAGAVEVFQSSSEQASGPRPGFSLNDELRNALWNASAFIMIYTLPDRDWSYCMYEYGVANNPNSPDTRMILMRCSEASPALFAGQVTVNARSREDVERFVNELLTAPEFFRGRTEAITQHQSRGRTVTALSEKLWQDLQVCLPTGSGPQPEEWPAYPYIRLCLDMVHVQTLRDAAAADRTRIALELIPREASVSDYDKVAGRLFNSPAFDKGVKLERLIQWWTEKNEKGDTQSRWVESLCRQIAEGARWQFPPLSWELMQGIDDDRWYAPMVTRVRRIPDQYYEFDVYFFRFDLDAQRERVVVGIPAS